MLPLILSLLFITAGTCWGQSSVLMDFQDRFVQHSQLVQPEIHAFSHRNDQARLQLIEWIVRAIGNLTIDMRHITNDAWAAIEANELLNDDCRQDVQDSFDFYVYLGAVDIMYCAFDMDYYMWYDATYRFRPQVRSTNRKNTRALSQTVQTLGEFRFVDHLDDVVDKLEEELSCYEAHWDEYQEILSREIEAIEPLEELVHSEMDWWYNYAIYWHLALMEAAVIDVDIFCAQES